MDKEYLKPIILKGIIKKLTINGNVKQVIIVGETDTMEITGSIIQTFNIDRNKIKKQKSSK
ncbi:hypothetical protein EHP00_79 [Ecytonucleospora hepatopenaei]|uniref:Uncharacterized protein n=1 Tax=Ecytonucleospora hepatopenaei TaxID=646526 RepID=A0A1W0E5P8_9MICR|nr:hypothetical protein EHP00_79 [Ecytonucleospora hepatopenaei]